jgi:hypothetical protein
MLYRDWETVSDSQWDGERITLWVHKQNRLGNSFWQRRGISVGNDSDSKYKPLSYGFTHLIGRND